LNEEIEMASRENLKAENFTWQRALAEMTAINEKELTRRHSENKRLIDVLNSWMSKYRNSFVNLCRFLIKNH